MGALEDFEQSITNEDILTVLLDAQERNKAN